MFQVRIIVNQSGAYPIDFRSDLITIRLASINQILDPWVYILFRKDVLVRIVNFGRHHTNTGSLFHRLSSMRSRTGSERSATDDVFEPQVSITGEGLLEESTHDKNNGKNNGLNGNVNDSSV